MKNITAKDFWDRILGRYMECDDAFIRFIMDTVNNWPSTIDSPNFPVLSPSEPFSSNDRDRDIGWR